MNHGKCATHKVYGLSCDDFEAMRARAQDRCELCGTEGGDTHRTRLYIDHAGGRSKTCEVRGLLCSNCNTSLGCMESALPRFAGNSLTDRERSYMSRPFRVRDLEREVELRAARDARVREREERFKRSRGSVNPHLAELAEAVAHHRVTQAKRHAADIELKAGIKAAAELGIQQAEIARITKYTREHVRNIIRNDLPGPNDWMPMRHPSS